MTATRATTGRGWRHFARRLRAMIVKEVIQLRRDRLTFAMMVSIPIMQLVLFGYAINMDPKRLPTALLSMDQSAYARSIVVALENTGYFQITHRPESVEALDYLVEAGRVQFAVEIPPGFARDLQRGERPALLVVADATDPAATGNAIATLNQVAATALDRDLPGPPRASGDQGASFEIIVHRRYNPAGDTQYNIVPGLLGVVLTLTMLIFTALAVTREIERGTMENLLALPVRPIEVMLGKIIPYIFVGFVQTALILSAAFLLFGVPMRGSPALLVGLTTLFIAAMLSVGYTFSTIARNQLQAVQMSFFFFLPNLLLSGFMFPFRGMPQWAQWLGEILPLTHFLRIVRGIMLKGSGMDALYRDVIALLVFTAVVMLIALRRYRQTLD
ncbi:MAG TPA: ABC transporter permease [Alphaproteobacteria bacterium]|nr:ABC transporter permease [Alphaproteobacteria bacterium]